MEDTGPKYSKSELRAMYFGLKSEVCCVKCGQDHPAALDLHHVKQEEKVNTLSGLIREGADITDIFEELDKCEVLCSSCHRIAHYESGETHPNREIYPCDQNALLLHWKTTHDEHGKLKI
jgi:hypothetical protein